MPVDPRIAPMVAALAARPAQPLADAAERRRQVAAATTNGSPYARFIEEEPQIADVHDEVIPVTDPPGEIAVRIYRPSPASGSALVMYHGGGWCLGSPADSDRRSRAIAAGAGAVVVSVDYRLAPEFPFPTPAEDAYQALLWTVKQADRLGFDAGRMGVAGESAGGNLAAAVCLLARERGGPALRLQLLEIPGLDLTLSSPSVTTYGEGYVLPREELRWAVNNYLGGHDPADPIASPLCATELAGLPPAVILTAECDSVADDGRRYAQRLTAAGVLVTFREFEGHVHGSHTLTALLPSAREWRAMAVAAVRDHLA
jgi:acetyl esterase